MKALSIKQPWAWLIVNGIKDIENRTWNTKFRGRFLVHASKAIDMQAYFSLRDAGLKLPDAHLLERGGIVGSVDLVNVIQPDKDTSVVYDIFNGINWHQAEQYGFVLRNPIFFSYSIPYRGQLNFFEIPNKVLAQPYKPEPQLAFEG